jgi:hypothetical protein
MRAGKFFRVDIIISPLRNMLAIIAEQAGRDTLRRPAPLLNFGVSDPSRFSEGRRSQYFGTNYVSTVNLLGLEVIELPS